MRQVSQEEHKNEFVSNLSEYVRVFWRKKYYLIVPIVVSGVISVIGVRFLEPIYESHSVIRMQTSDFLSEDVTKYVQDEERSRRHNRTIMDRETLMLINAEISSSEFLDKIITTHKLNAIPELLNSAALIQRNKYPHMSVQEIVHRGLYMMLRRKIDVSNVGPGMFMISFVDSDPRVCYVIAHTITNIFVEEQVRKKLRGLQEASDFSDGQLVIYKEQLEKSERELLRIKTALAQQRYSENPVVEANIGDAEALKKHIETQLNERRITVNKTRQNALKIIGYLPSSEKIWGDQTLSGLEDKLVNLRQTELVIELSGGQETSGRGAINSEQIFEAEQEMQRYLTNLMESSFANIPVEHRLLFVEYFHQIGIFRGIEEKYNVLNSFIGSFRKNLELIPEMENEVSRMEQEVESNRELYYSFLRAKTSAQISEAVAGVNLGFYTEIIESAKEPFTPERPNKIRIILLSLIFGGALGTLSILLSEYINTSFKSVVEIERTLELKVIGVIPNFEGKSLRERTSLKSFVWFFIILVSAIIAFSGFYYYGKNTKSNALNVHNEEIDVR